MARGDDDRLQIALRAPATRRRERLGHALAVADHVAVLDADVVAGHADDTLDIRLRAGARRRPRAGAAAQRAPGGRRPLAVDPTLLPVALGGARRRSAA